MNNQEFRSTSPQYRLVIGLGLLAMFLLVAVIAGLLAPDGDQILVFRDMFASVAILIGLLGLLIYAARERGWWLPSFLQVPEERRDTRWRLLVLSLAIIAFPVLMIVTQQLLHQ